MSTDKAVMTPRERAVAIAERRSHPKTTAQLIDMIQEAIAAAVAQERAECAKAVCPYCRADVPGKLVLGRFEHQHPRIGTVKCLAADIRARQDDTP